MFGQPTSGRQPQIADPQPAAPIDHSRQPAPSSRYQFGVPSSSSHQASRSPHRSFASHSRSLLYPQLNAPNFEPDPQPSQDREDRFYTPLQELPTGNQEGIFGNNHGGQRHQHHEEWRGREPDAFSPRSQQKRRGFAHISESQLHTPPPSMHRLRNVENESTVKPNLQDTVARSALNGTHRSQLMKPRSLRLATRQGMLGNQSHFGAGGFGSANFLNRTAGGLGAPQAPSSHLQKSPFAPAMTGYQMSSHKRAVGQSMMAEQQRSPQFGGGAPTDGKRPASRFDPRPVPESRTSNSLFAADQALNTSAHFAEGESCLDFIKQMSFENKQKAIDCCRTIVEDMAAGHADLAVNDLSRQLEKRTLDGSIVPGSHHQYEFEPTQYQASAQSLIPKDVRGRIKEAQALLHDADYVSRLTPVQRLNLKECVGSYVEDHHYIVLGRTLTLWKSATTTEHGVNVFGAGARLADASVRERRQRVREWNEQNAQQFFFEYPIQRVHYIEHYQRGFQPYMIVVTQEDIQLRRFKKREHDDNRLDISMADASESSTLSIQRSKYDLTQIEELGASDYTPQTIEQKEEVSAIYQVKKNGRLFYASHTDGYKKTYVKELTFSEGSDKIKYVSQRLPTSVRSFASSYLSSSKRINSKNVQDGNQVLHTVRAMVPSFADFYSERKCIEDIQVDESRNCVYVLTSKLVPSADRTPGRAEQEEPEELEEMENVPEGDEEVDVMTESAIDVYDLGVFGDQFRKIVKITQEKIFQLVQTSVGRSIKKNTDEYRKELALHKICSMHPITAAESQQRHLLLTTRNNLRLFVAFRTDPQPENQAEACGAFVEGLKLQHEDFREECLTERWALASVHSVPLESEALKIYSQGAAEGHHPNPFKINVLSKQYHNPQHGAEAQYGVPRVRTTFCNNSSAFIYSDGQNLAALDTVHQYLNVSFLTKNEGSYCFSRARAGDGQYLCTNETFSMLQIQKLHGGLDDEDQGDAMEELSDQPAQLQDQEETILQIRNPNEDSYNHGYFNREVDLSLQKMLGASPALRLDPHWGYSNALHRMPLSAVEKQVYDEASLQPIRILTNKRHLTIVQLRPIDQLAQILVATAGQPPENYSVNEFEAFARKYTLEELCCMLVQIISEQQRGRYYYSRKVHQAITLARQSERRLHDARTQRPNDRNGQFSHMQPRQVRGMTSGQLKRPAPMTQRSVGSLMQSAFHAAAPSPNLMGRPTIVEHHGSGMLVLPFVFNQSEDFLPHRGPRLDRPQGEAGRDRVAVADEDIIREMYSSQNEINSNCHLQALGGHHPAIAFAKSLLMIYGDSIDAESHDKIIGYYQMKSQKIQAILDPKLLTLRYRALFTYAQRILRPIWDMNITQRQCRAHPLDKQRMSVEVFEPALHKLTNLLNTLESCQKDLTLQTSAEDQSKLLRHDLAQMRSADELGIQSTEILDQVYFTYAMDNQIKEKIEQSQKKVLKSLMVFVRRCIDAIQFLKIISFREASDAKIRRELFQAMMNQIQNSKDGKAFLRELADTKYKDLVLQGGSQETLFECQQDESIGQIILDALGSSEARGTGKSRLIRKLYDNCIHIAVAKENTRGSAGGALSAGFNVQTAIQQRALQIQTLCPTMFTTSQTTTFIGQSILHQAVSETDSKKQDELIRQGMVQLLKLPQNIKLDLVVPDLCKTQRYQAIVELCMQKIQRLQQIIDQNKAQRQSLSVSGASSRHRLNQSMHSVSSSPGDPNQSQLAIDDLRDPHSLVVECYDVICNLFLALDSCIQDLKEANLAGRVELLLELEKRQKDDTGRRYSDRFATYSKNFQGTEWYPMFYNHFAAEVGHLTGKSPTISLQTPRHLQNAPPQGIQTKHGKIRLRRDILQMVESYGDFKLIKALFVHMIGQPREYIQLEDLPRIDAESFIDICRHIFAQPEILKTTIDTLIKLMRAKDRFSNPQASEAQRAETRAQITQRLCEFVLRLCEENTSRVVNPVPVDPKSSSSKQTRTVHLTCQEKIAYCQGALDEAQGVGDSTDAKYFLQHSAAPISFADHIKKLQECIETLRYQQKVSNAAEERIKYMEQFEQKAHDKVKDKIMKRITQLKQQRAAFDTINCKKSELDKDLVEKYQLYSLMYEKVRAEEQHRQRLIHYDDSAEMQSRQFVQEYLDIFDKSVDEVLLFTQDCVALKFAKPGTDPHVSRRWTNTELMKALFACFDRLRSHTSDRGVAVQALRKVIRVSTERFLCDYGHDPQRAFGLLTTSATELRASDVSKNEVFAVIGLALDVIRRQTTSADLTPSDIRRFLEEMYSEAVQSVPGAGARGCPSASLRANLLLCHMLAYIYVSVNLFTRHHKTLSPPPGLRALQHETLEQLLRPAPTVGAGPPHGGTFEGQLEEIQRQRTTELELLLPADYSNVIGQLIVDINDDMVAARRVAGLKQ